MKKMQILLVAIVLAIFTCQPLMAQNSIDPKAKAAERKATLTKQLSLSADQADKVYDATLKFWTKALEVSEAGHPQAEARKLNKATNEEFEKSLKEILTEEQYSKLLKIREEVAARQKAKRNNQ